MLKKVSKIFICFLTPLLLFLIVNIGTVAAAETVLMGDVNGDGLVKVNDARLALIAAINIEPLTGNSFKAADFNSNNKIDIHESRKILRLAVDIETLDDETEKNTAAPLQSGVKKTKTTEEIIEEYTKEVLNLVNKERTARNLSPLSLCPTLSNVAQTKAYDMLNNNYFAHNSPTYGSPFNMLKSFGVKYNIAGENLAWGYNAPDVVMYAWMNSNGHRANILDSRFSKIGIAYSVEGHYWVQLFTG